jgi:hypothetical protein
MNPYYYNELPVTGADEEMMMSVLLILLGVLAVALLVSVIFWIISSLSLQAIARRRGIRNAWLAWVPIGNQWILGSIADQYQHLIQGKITSRRKILLWLGLANFVVSVIGGILSGVIGATAQTEEQMMVFSVVNLVSSLGGMALGITVLVFYHMSNYDLYRSCNPKNAVTFLVLGIIFPVAQPFFYLSCRKKDLGMVVPEIVTAPAEIPMASPEF